MIKEIKNKNLSAWAEYCCEGCGNTQISYSGYNDKYYHENVIPNIQCKNCGESTITLGAPIVPYFVSCKEMTIEERVKCLEEIVDKLVTHL